MTLIELMVALAIGAFLMLGAITVFMQSRTSFRVNETLSRLQENARFALESMEPDIRMAHYWGLTPRTYLIQGRAGPGDPAGLGTHPCGNNFWLNLNEAVDGTNNTYNWACAPGGGVGAAAVPNSDTLIVRRTSEDAIAAAALVANVLYVQSTRSQLGQIFAGTVLPAGFNAATSETHRLVVNGYYVSNMSAIPGMPALRRKVLAPAPASIGAVADEEVLIGVEDMQIQFGVDSDVPGTPVAPNPNRGVVDRWVNPDDPMIDPTNAGFDPNAEILAVRVWLRLRGERIENGLIDNTDYEYADRDFGTFADGFRRLLVSKTIYLRNARPAL
jgi:type II secretory pathway pseudopilin PulG